MDRPTRWRWRPSVVPSPEPVRLVELPIVRRLLDLGVVVIAAGGGGIPVVEAADGSVALVSRPSSTRTSRSHVHGRDLPRCLAGLA